ncbi:MAG: DUF6324 family protein [Pseudomonadota bacterium]
MGINTESDIAATLTIGPTSEGMVRLYVEGGGVELPMDFDPEEALEIAEELRQAAELARRSQPPATSMGGAEGERRDLPDGRKRTGDGASGRDRRGKGGRSA